MSLKSLKENVHLADLTSYFFPDMILRYVDHPEAVGDAFERIWPLFKAIFDQ